MDNYAKHFASMYSGSMYGAGIHVFAVWGWILAHKDADGLVELNPRMVASELGGTVEQVSDALTYLSAPDPESRSTDEEGRRIVKVSQFGYRVVNHAKYRDRGQDRTEYWREYRAKRKTERNSAQQLRATDRTHADADADADADVNVNVHPPANDDSSWTACKSALQVAYGTNKTIESFICWLSNEYLIRRCEQSDIDAACQRVRALIRKSRDKENPAGWFIGAVKRPTSDDGFGYRPIRRRSSPEARQIGAGMDDVVRALTGRATA